MLTNRVYRCKFLQMIIHKFSLTLFGEWNMNSDQQPQEKKMYHLCLLMNFTYKVLLLRTLFFALAIFNVWVYFIHEEDNQLSTPFFLCVSSNPTRNCFQSRCFYSTLFWHSTFCYFKHDEDLIFVCLYNHFSSSFFVSHSLSLSFYPSPSHLLFL